MLCLFLNVRESPGPGTWPGALTDRWEGDRTGSGDRDHLEIQLELGFFRLTTWQVNFLLRIKWINGVIIVKYYKFKDINNLWFCNITQFLKCLWYENVTTAVDKYLISIGQQNLFITPLAKSKNQTAFALWASLLNDQMNIKFCLSFQLISCLVSCNKVNLCILYNWANDIYFDVQV